MFDFNSAMEFIEGFDKGGKPIVDLNRISALLDSIENPQNKLKYIHIAGTNGKGSVAEMCSFILIKAGYKVGLFTSPFIVEYRDRIRVNNVNISRDNLTDITRYISNYVNNLEYKDSFSQFEITTAIAFEFFSRQHCDIVVLEAGIGGALDSTNIIKSPIVSIITSISYDHTNILGDTLEQIAFQKAGIIKDKRPCILSANNETEVVNTIQRYANEKKSPVIIPNFKLLQIISSTFLGSEFDYKSKRYKMKMAGEHQIINAISVIEAMEQVKSTGFFIKDTDIFNGIESTRVFARAEALSTQPLILLDGAHNQAGMRALGKLVGSLPQKSKISIIGMLKDKNIEASIKEMLPYIKDYICIDGFHPNAVSADELALIIEKNGGQAYPIVNMKFAINEAKKMISEDSLLLICGSLYLASQVRKMFIN